MKHNYENELALVKKKRAEIISRLKVLSDSPEDDVEYFELMLWLWKANSLIRQAEKARD